MSKVLTEAHLNPPVKKFSSTETCRKYYAMDLAMRKDPDLWFNTYVMGNFSLGVINIKPPPITNVST